MNCAVDGCVKEARAGRKSGLCSMHAQRIRRGAPLNAPPARTFAPFDALIEPGPNDCWLWTGALTTEGYGRYRAALAHRYSYELHIGEIPDGLHLDHLCRTRSCVNAWHLEPVTARVNTLRGETLPAANAAKTHCVNDHEFTPENTRTNTDGSRGCRACARERARAQREAA